MAGLTLKDFRGKHGDTRIIALIEKLIEGTKSPFTTTDGKQVPFNKITYPDPKSGRLITKNAADVSDSSDIFNLIKSSSISAKTIQLSYERNGRVTSLVPLSDIMKTEEFGGKANRGDMAELIFSAAIVCRFLNKNQAIIDADVLDMVKNLSDTDSHQTLGPMKSPNKNDKVIDDLYWEVNSSLINIKAIKNPRHLKNLKSIISSSVKYANSATVANNAKKYYENSLYNRIDVKAIGTVAQNDTKIDVFVAIDNKKIDINVSLKAAGTKQFGQVGGGTIEKQKFLWSTLLDFKISSSLEKKYFVILKSDGIIAANSMIYNAMSDMFNANFNTNPDKVLDSLADGIMFFGTRHDRAISMVQLTNKEAMIYKFDNLQTALKLKNIKLYANFVDNKTKPEVRFQDIKTGKVLITLRLRSDKEYLRNVIEKGALMTELVGFMAT
jgi:hypothetical protein